MFCSSSLSALSPTLEPLDFGIPYRMAALLAARSNLAVVAEVCGPIKRLVALSTILKGSYTVLL
jgi:hypothetical protein